MHAIRWTCIGGLCSCIMPNKSTVMACVAACVQLAGRTERKQERERDTSGGESKRSLLLLAMVTACDRLVAER